MPPFKPFLSLLPTPNKTKNTVLHPYDVELGLHAIFFNLSWPHWSSVMINKEHDLSNILKPAVAMYWEAALKGQNQWPRWRLDHQPWWSYQLKTLAIPKPPLNTNLRAAMKEGRKKKNRSKWKGKREREKKRKRNHPTSTLNQRKNQS
jgi:hypothetical protein